MIKKAYILWGVLYILCAGLGFIQKAEGFGRIVLIFLAVLFFLPPAFVLYQSQKADKRKEIVRICKLSAISLAATLVLLVLNMLSVTASEIVGNILHVILVLVSSPMFCAQYWVLGLFGWACLMLASYTMLPKTKK